MKDMKDEVKNSREFFGQKGEMGIKVMLDIKKHKNIYSYQCTLVTVPDGKNFMNFFQFLNKANILENTSINI